MTDNQNMSLHSSVPPNLNQTWNVHGARSHIHYQKYSRRTCTCNGLVWHMDMDMYLFCAWVQVYIYYLSLLLVLNRGRIFTWSGAMQQPLMMQQCAWRSTYWFMIELHMWFVFEPVRTSYCSEVCAKQPEGVEMPSKWASVTTLQIKDAARGSIDFLSSQWLSSL
jgi:hypothetical protein